MRLETWQQIINHIDKKAFVASFARVFELAFSRANIRLSFRLTGFVPYNPSVVLPTLEPVPRTPSPALPEITQWDSKISIHATESEAQTTMIVDRIYQRSSTSPTLKMVIQLGKGTQKMMNKVTLLEH